MKPRSKSARIASPSTIDSAFVLAAFCDRGLLNADLALMACADIYLCLLRPNAGLRFRPEDAHA